MLRRSPALRVVLDPDDRPEHAAPLQQMHSPAHGVVVIEPVTGPRTLHALAGAVMHGLGKELPRAATRDAATDAWIQAQAWMTGERIHALLMTRAHLLPPRRWEQLAELGAVAETDVWFVVQAAGLSRGQKEFARDWALHVEEFGALVDAFSLSTPPSQTPRSPRPAFPDVPDDEFPLFLASALANRTASDAQQIEQAYFQTFDDVFAQLKTGISLDEQALSLVIESIGRGCGGDLNEALVRMRAMQAASFRHGYLVSLDVHALAAGYTNLPLAAATPENLDRLRAIHDPQTAALGVVALASHQPPPLIAPMNLQDMDPDGARIVVADQRLDIPQAGHGLLRAQRLYRLWQGANDEEPLFVSEDRASPDRGLKRTTPHGLQTRLRGLARKTGLVLTSRDSWGLGNPRRWLKRRGITLNDLNASA